MESVKETIIRIIKNKIGADNDISIDDTFSELGLDSLDQVEVLMDVEHKLEVTVPDENFEHLDTPAKLIAHIEKIMIN